MSGSRALVVSLLVAVAVPAAHGRAPQTPAPVTGQLRVGETLRIEGTRIALFFEAVRSDSRCPKDAHCIRAGEAVLILQVQEAGRESTSVAFRVPPGGGDTQSSHGYRIEIIRLDPQADADVDIPQSRYVVTLRAGRA